MSANIAFVMLNKEKKIQGISSGAMNVLNLDIQKMRRLNTSGIDINQLAPAIFDANDENSFNQKQGAILDWYMPDFTGGKKKKTTDNQKTKKNGNPEDQKCRKI